MMKRESEERLNSLSLCCTLRSNSKAKKGQICVLPGGDEVRKGRKKGGDGRMEESIAIK